MDIGTQLAKSLISTAHELADAAREVTLAHFRTAELATDDKGSGAFDPVTMADRLSERRMRDILALRRPLDGILGEEYANVDSRNGLTWVIDPIDGTRSYISGCPTWGVLIAVADEQGPIYGLIDQPYIGERFEGGLGRALMKGPHGSRALKTRIGRDVSTATLFTTFPEIGTKEEEAAFRRVAQKVRLTRYGMDCYAYALLALGQVDLVIEAGLHPYDVQGPIAVIEAAGGIVTDWRGGPCHMGGQLVAAANDEIHAAALDLLNRDLA